MTPTKRAGFPQKKKRREPGRDGVVCSSSGVRADKGAELVYRRWPPISPRRPEGSFYALNRRQRYSQTRVCFALAAGGSLCLWMAVSRHSWHGVALRSVVPLAGGTPIRGLVAAVTSPRRRFCCSYLPPSPGRAVVVVWCAPVLRRSPSFRLFSA